MLQGISYKHCEHISNPKKSIKKWPYCASPLSLITFTHIFQSMRKMPIITPLSSYDEVFSRGSLFQVENSFTNRKQNQYNTSQ